MDIDDYQKNAAKTAIYREEHAVAYNALQLSAEAGEVAGKVAKVMLATGTIDDKKAAAISAELGDLLWHVAAMATALGMSLSDIAKRNLEKTTSRAERNVLIGSGDDR